MWAQALSRRESLDEGRYFQAMIWRDRASSHKLPMPRLWVGSERLAEFAKSKQSEGYERPTQLRRRSNMAIYPKIETRRAKRRNGAAYQHRRRRSLTGGHAVITHCVAWSTTALIACSIRIRSQDSPPRHGPIVLRCPGNGREAPMSKKARKCHRTQKESNSRLTGPDRLVRTLSVRRSWYFGVREHTIYYIDLK